MKGAQHRFVVLTPGWSGSSALAAVFGRSPQIRSSGSVLREPVPAPAAHLRERLHDEFAPCVGAVIQPDDLWLVNAVDPQRFIDDLVADGIQLLILQRRSIADRGLSRALCGPGLEVLPREAIAVDPGEVAVHALHAQRARDWFDASLPETPRLYLEDDVVGGAGVVDLMVSLFGVEPWDVPPPRRAPTHDQLWAKVASPDRLAADLAVLTPMFGLT